MQDTSAVPVGPLPQNAAPATPLANKLRSSFGASMGVASAAPQQVPTVSTSPTPVPSVVPEVAELPDGEKLGVFSAILDQIEAEQPAATQPAPGLAPVPPQSDQAQASVLDQALPTAVAASTDTLNPSVPVGSAVAKERQAGSDQGAVEAAAGVQVVEQEPNPEIPVEVESYMQRVVDHAQTGPQEVVIADGTQEQPKAAYPSRPVVVLPITEEVEDEGAKMSPKFSIRWLIEWSHKIIKMFAGKVIYRQLEVKEP